MTASVLAEGDLLTAELPVQPYPGLRPFEMSEWSIFFGREPMIDEIIELLGRQRVVVVHGSSGAGKSSLIRAGVLPRLARQHRRRRVPWMTCAIRPSGGPLWNLASALAELEGGKPNLEASDAIRREFDRPNARLSNIVANRPALRGKRVCVLIDQFEEIFRYAKETSRDEVELLIDLLSSMVNDEEGSAPSLHVLITMRSEFLGECARLPNLAQAINRAQYLLPPMDYASLRRAICRPAELFGGRIDDGLAERLITDGRREQDELPLIQHALMLMWQRASQSSSSPSIGAGDSNSAPRTAIPVQLNLDLYLGEGGLAAMLSDHADRLMRSVIPESEVRGARVFELLFRALTDINAEGLAIRNPQSFRKLCAITGADGELVRAILDTFRAEGASFLTPYAPTQINPDTIIDISHEALIRSWSRISDRKTGWLQAEFRDGLDWRILRARSSEGSVISAAAIPDREVWLQNLNQAWSERYGGGWPDVSRLMEDSREARNRALRSRRRKVAAGIAGFAMLATAGVWFSFEQTRQAEEKSRLADAAQASAYEAAASAEKAARSAKVAEERALRAEAVALWYPLTLQREIGAEVKRGLLALASAEPIAHNLLH